jgi:hypothetical protein
MNKSDKISTRICDMSKMENQHTYDVSKGCSGGGCSGSGCSGSGCSGGSFSGSGCSDGGCSDGIMGYVSVLSVTYDVSCVEVTSSIYDVYSSGVYDVRLSLAY